MHFTMETILQEIFNELRKGKHLDDKLLAKMLHRHNKNLSDNRQHFVKKKLLPFYLKVKEADPARWESWNVTPGLEKQMLALLQVKPRRTASGVATITVITKPWACASDCIYCPNDLRMPKSYLSDEPACQRAERNYFDPYLQVASRLRALTHMGHPTDKIELIVLGGTWNDYPLPYQIWFVAELFRALNDDDLEHNAKTRRAFYKSKGILNTEESLTENARAMQQKVNEGLLTYRQAIASLYGKDSAWEEVSLEQCADFDELEEHHRRNENARHRVVGLVVETRPDLITADSLKLLRRLGCTKIQMGIQSLDPHILKANNRAISLEKIREAFALLRIFGFKIHAHFMVNLYGSSPEADKADYQRFVTEEAYLPDEVKLYPCVLVNGTKLNAHYADKTWRPYSEEELVDVLVADTLATPSFMRISRMIRDISAHDIVAGNKKTNLRQMVERKIEELDKPIAEIRYREISTNDTNIEQLALKTQTFATAVTQEFFLEWVTPENRIAGFLRLSLPKADYVHAHRASLPFSPREAMIREVHIYGKVAQLKQEGTSAQHLGLGKQLIEEACAFARAEGYEKINVISSVGTREYYRSLGFRDNDLYQQLAL